MQAIIERQIKIRTIELMKAHKKSSKILGLKNESYFNKHLKSDILRGMEHIELKNNY